MGYVCILAEKPDMAAKIAATFNYKKRNGYYEIEKCKNFPGGAYVVFAIGHLVQLSSPGLIKEEWGIWSLNHLPIIPEVFKYNIIKGKGDAFNTIKKIANDPSVSELILACDAGREGELIGISIFKLVGVYGKKPLKRLWVSSTTKEALQKGFNNLLDGSKTLQYYYEAYSRSVCDYMVGINLTRAMTLLLQNAGIQSNTPFSVGRVQTAVLKIIVDREREIENFVSKPFWTVQAVFNVNNKEYEGKWYRIDKDNKITNFEDKKQAEEILKSCLNQQAIVKDVVKERKVIQPPKLHSLSSLQTLAGKKFKYSPSETLEIAQKLYVKSYISYPRSESDAITKEEAKQFPDIFRKLKEIEMYSPLLPTPIQSENLTSRYIDPKRVSDHYAIIPTEQIPDISKLTQEELNIYDIIVRSVIAAHYDNAVFDHTSITTVVNSETFSTTGKVLVSEGWRKVIYPNGREDDKEEVNEDSDEKGMLPQLSKDEKGIAKIVNLKEGKTTPKPRLSSANLINVMKYPEKFMSAGQLLEEELEGEIASVGIGTEATRAGIIDTLIARDYIEVKKNKVYATKKGRILIAALGNKTILTSPIMTAKWENVLEKIGKNQFDYRNFIEQGKKLTTDSLNKIIEHSKGWNFDSSLEVLGTCPECNSKVVDNGRLYACEKNISQEQCNFHIGHTILKKKISASQIKKLLKNGETDIIKGFTSASKGNKFDAKLVWDKTQKKTVFSFGNENKPKSETKPLGLKCPFCSSELLDRGTFIGCTGFVEKKCKFTIFKKVFEKELSDNDIKDLLQNGETQVLEGFKGKYGPMKGKLLLCHEDKKVKFHVHK